MDRLIEGYRRFRAFRWPYLRDLFVRLAAVGQKPKALVIACSDSRADPQTVFDAVPGELFVVRNVAALVPPYSPDKGYHGTSAAIEFAVQELGVTDIVVMGHARCGGVAALISGAPKSCPDFVESWTEIAAEARQRALKGHENSEDLQRRCEHEALRTSLANLMTFPWVRAKVATGELTVHGCHFDIANGELHQVEHGVVAKIR
jgi:carbonic anhydrase